MRWVVGLVWGAVVCRIAGRYEGIEQMLLKSDGRDVWYNLCPHPARPFDSAQGERLLPVGSLRQGQKGCPAGSRTSLQKTLGVSDSTGVLGRGCEGRRGGSRTALTEDIAPIIWRTSPIPLLRPFDIPKANLQRRSRLRRIFDRVRGSDPSPDSSRGLGMTVIRACAG